MGDIAESVLAKLKDEYLNEIKGTQWVDMITKGLEDNIMKAWVATIEDKIISCTCVGNSRYQGYEGQLELFSIYVLPEYWNLGTVYIHSIDNVYK